MLNNTVSLSYSCLGLVITNTISRLVRRVDHTKSFFRGTFLCCIQHLCTAVHADPTFRLYMFFLFPHAQETPDEIPEGETPATATVFAFDDLVDAVRPGDRCFRLKAVLY